MAIKNPKISKGLKRSWDDPNSGFHSENRKDKISKATISNFAVGTDLRNYQIQEVKKKWKDPNSIYNSKEHRENLSKRGGIRYVTEIETKDLCSYGCGRVAKYKFGSGKICCEKAWQTCPEKRSESRDLILVELSKPDSWFHSKERSDMSRERMLNGGAAYALSFRNDVSKPQLELFEIISNICPYVILEYPCLNYKIDIAVPSLNLAIEYDGSYWHQDKEYDNKRQKELEEEGWIFLRYVDYVPGEIEAFDNIRKLINDTT